MSFQHLLAELARIDVLIRRQVVRWQAAGQDPDDNFRGLRITDDEATALAARPFGTSWGDLAPADAERESVFAAQLEQAEHNIRETVAAFRHQGAVSRLEALAEAFQLTRFDLDIFLVVLAPALDQRYERLYGYLQDDVTRKRPSVNLVLDLLCEPGAERLLRHGHFADDAALFKFNLIERVAEANTAKPLLLGQTLLPDESVVAWLLGEYQPRPELAAHARLVAPEPDHTDALLSSTAWPDLEQLILGQSPQAWPLVACYGADRAAQFAVARRTASHLRRLLLEVNLAGAIDPDLPPLRVVQLVLRDARLTGAVPCLIGWDACLTEGAPSPSLMAALCEHPDLVFIASHAAWQARSLQRERNLLWLECPIPDFHQRRALWSHFAAGASLPGESLDMLAGQFLLTADQIRDSVASARDSAVQRGAALAAGDLLAAARAHSSPNLAGLARKITPRYIWHDIILPEDQTAILREIVATVRGRPKVLEEWGVGEKLASSAGVTVLFAGQPGTGKTMAAEVIAAELGLDLYKIDLSTIVSKYIGETEKNLERIFTEAQSSNAILFFDEADAIFGKRSEVKDAHDRYANIEVSYLLQRMEQYDGVTILATNLRANIDDAFTRRLQFAVDFPFPDETYRLRIWETLFPLSVPRAPDVDLIVMARRFKLAGGNIRNIIVSAAFLAASDGGQLSMAHLLHGARREMQKMGRLIKEKDLTG